MSDTRTTPALKSALLDAILPHVAFDGWSPTAFAAAVREVDIAPALADALCPRGAVDLALAFHERGDAQMVATLQASDLGQMRFRDRIAKAVRLRLEAVAADKEAVRRGTALFALPHLAADGAKAIWGTADAIWTALGDRSDDYNWYSKRATLSGVYGATVLYWLGDDSEGHAATWAFLDRRIDEVMQVEKAKKTVRENPVLSRALSGPAWVLGKIKAPQSAQTGNYPGRWSDPSSGV